MTPLAELAPNLVHPIINRTISDLLNNLPDKSAVKRWLTVRTQRVRRRGAEGRRFSI